jgi:hypothetical protein
MFWVSISAVGPSAPSPLKLGMPLRVPGTEEGIGIGDSVPVGTAGDGGASEPSGCGRTAGNFTVLRRSGGGRWSSPSVVGESISLWNRLAFEDGASVEIPPTLSA